jgi:bifunctional non-homologous end joining protein LigD
MKPLYLPMLAQAAEPFDHADYQFEIKWDGVRALAAVDASGWRLWGRTGTDYTSRYPELAVLQNLPSGTLVDGEVVVLHQGRADFPALLRRHQRTRPPLVAWAGHGLAVSYMAFDLLVDRGRPLLQAPLRERRARLRDLLAAGTAPALVYSDDVVGQGREFFAQAVAQGHEGIVAKHVASGYQPGKRSVAWKKIKPAGVLPCVLIGYRAGRHGVQRVLLATLRSGGLHYVGQLSRGFGGEARVMLAAQLATLQRACPVLPCPQRASWIEPVLYCRVHHQGWTSNGRLRHPVFGGWLQAEHHAAHRHSSEFLAELP